MRRILEFFLVLFLFLSCCTIVMVKNEVVVDAFGAVRDTFDSFDNLSLIGLVVNDTSSLDVTYEQPIYYALINAGMSVFKIDTTTLDDSLFDANGIEWDSLQVVIVCFGTDSATIDTSQTKGIGEVPVLVLEPYYWNEFGLPDSSASSSQDSFRINGAFGFIDTSVIWSADDSVALYSSTGIYYPMGAPAFDANALVLDLAGTDTVAVFDTLNGQPRIAFGLVDCSKWNDNEGMGWTLFNRFVSRLSSTYSDSIFQIGLLVETKNDPGSDGGQLKNHIELNGHILRLVDDDSLGNSTTYNGSGNNWSDLDGFIFWKPNVGVGGDEDNVVANINSILSFNPSIGDSLGIVNATGNTFDLDTVKVINISSSLTSIYTLNQLLDISRQIEHTGTRTTSKSGASSLMVDENSGVSVLSINNASRYAWTGVIVPGFATEVDSLNQNGWGIINRGLGWIFESKPNPPSGLSSTSISTDSIGVSWTDNASSEDGYSVFVYDPDSMYFSHLGANAVSDSLFPFWPPNSRIIWDVAVVDGIDTVFSIDGKDTVWTLAETPPSVFTKNLTDTSMSFYVNGYLFDERFDDEDYDNNPTWTVQKGGFEVDTTKRQLRSTDATQESIISTPFVDVSGDSVNDGEWFISYKFSDSTSFDQGMSFFIMAHKSSLDDSSGYKVVVTASTGFVLFGRLLDDGSVDGSHFTVSSTGVSAQEVFKWHTLRIIRDYDGSPQDTTIDFTIYLDGDSVAALNEDDAPSKYYTSAFIGVKLDSNDVMVDNIQFRQLRPSANHDSTQYAVQDSVTGLYVHDSPDTLRSAEDWRTLSQWGGAAGDTLTNLSPDSTVVLRSKARNEWP